VKKRAKHSYPQTMPIIHMFSISHLFMWQLGCEKVKPKVVKNLGAITPLIQPITI